MTNNMKSPNEYQQYDMNKGNNDQKWQKKGNMPKGKDANYIKEEKGEYSNHQQYQKHPNRKNFSSYSNKNQGEDYDKSNSRQKGNNQSPNYKKNQKYKRDNGNEGYLTNVQMDDNQSDKDDYQPYRKAMTQQNLIKEGGGGGYNQKVNKGKYGQHSNGNYALGQGQGQNQNQGQGGNMPWDKSPMTMPNTQLQQNQFQMGGYYDRKNNPGNQYSNQPNPSLNVNPNQNTNNFMNQYNQQGQGQYNYNKPNVNMLQQGKRMNVMNNNNNMYNNPQIQGDYISKSQGMYQYSNTEGNIPSNMSTSINQEQEPSNDSEDNYLQQQQQQHGLQVQGQLQNQNQFMFYKGLNINDQMDNPNSFISDMNEPSIPGSMNSSNISYLSASPLQPYQNPMHNMPPMNTMNRGGGYQPEMFMPQPIMNQSNNNKYLNDPQMMKGINRNIPMINMPQQIPFGIDQSNQMFQMPQVAYGMNNQPNTGMMTKTKKKSSKKIPQSPQDGGMNNVKGGMKMHHINNNGKIYKGSHSTQGVKNTMPNFNGANLSFMNMNNMNNSNIISNNINNNSISCNSIVNNSLSQRIPMQMNPIMNNNNRNSNINNNQGQPKTVYKAQKKNMSNNSSSNPFRNVTSDKTIGSGISSAKSRSNEYYTNTKPQENIYYNFQNPQLNKKNQQKYDDIVQGGEYDDDISNQDLNEINNPNGPNAETYFNLKLRLEENKEVIIEIKQNEDLISIANTLQQYKINENQMTLIYTKIIEAVNILNYVMNVRLNPYDRKQISALSQVMHLPVTHNSEHKKRKHHFFPLIQIDKLNRTFSDFNTQQYNHYLDIQPDYNDIRQCELLNITQ